MPKSVRYLALGLIGLAGLGFLGGIFLAGYYTLWVKDAPQPTLMPEFVSGFVTAAGAVLGTNLGAALGIRVTLKRWRWAPEPNPAETLRIVAAYFYVGCLLAAFAFWMLSGFSQDPNRVVSILPELSRILGGVLVGTLAVMLGVPQEVAAADSTG